MMMRGHLVIVEQHVHMCVGWQHPLVAFCSGVLCEGERKRLGQREQNGAIKLWRSNMRSRVWDDAGYVLDLSQETKSFLTQERYEHTYTIESIHSHYHPDCQ
jgi:hypothetical protein